MCSDGSCKEDFIPVNLGGLSMICRKPEEAAAQLGQNHGGNGGNSGGNGDGQTPPPSTPAPLETPEETPSSTSSGGCGTGGQPVCAGDQMNGARPPLPVRSRDRILPFPAALNQLQPETRTRRMPVE